MTSISFTIMLTSGATVHGVVSSMDVFLGELHTAKERRVLVGLGADPTTWINPDHVLAVQVTR